MTTMKMAMAMGFVLAAIATGCAVEGEGPEASETSEDALRIGPTSSTKTKSELLADGYTCATLEGTTVTLCWKNGSPGYTCNDRGTCTQDLRKGTNPYIVAPAPTLVVAP